MSDRMILVSFQELLFKLLKEYKSFGTLLGVPVEKNRNMVPIGPAAGPHTQLSGNMIAAYAAGASYFEFKTVQIMEGEELGLKKPCIFVNHEVYNTEWSTELTVKEAKNEYIKAYLLIQVLSRELGLNDADHMHFVMSIGYDMKGIQSDKIDSFLNDMKQADTTKEWKRDIAYLMDSIHLFENLTLEDIKGIEKKSGICDTVTLSTMHGCPKEEIESIAKYLIETKGLNTYIKLNPTLVGKEMATKLLNEKGYQNIVFCTEGFDADITLLDAVTIIKNCQQVAKQHQKEFGVKLTNTFPVKIMNQELEGSEMYMSGPALYAISITAAKLLAEKLEGNLNISYSGGADASNVKKILETNIRPVTVSSILLKPGGYKNLTRMKQKVLKDRESITYENDQAEGLIDLSKLRQLALQAIEDTKTNQKNNKKYEKSKEYTAFCAKCKNCVDVCPNRANVLIEMDGSKYVLHKDSLCNECGCCVSSCAMGHIPYLEKFTIFDTKEAFEDSNNNGILLNDKINQLRNNSKEDWNQSQIEKIIRTGIKNSKL